VSGRIDPNRTLAPVVISARVLGALCEHARETHPEECCGLLTGPAAGCFAEAHRCRNEMTLLHRRDPSLYPRSGDTAFHMNEGDVLRVAEAAEGRRWLVTGVYHSHTEAGAYFSELDQDFARQPGFPFPLAQHVVISVLDGLVGESAVFRRVDEPPGFEGRVLLPSAP
jgi:sulfur-carrier protein adenylyltransferase/sulfurtransferase